MVILFSAVYQIVGKLRNIFNNPYTLEMKFSYISRQIIIIITVLLRFLIPCNFFTQLLQSVTTD